MHTITAWKLHRIKAYCKADTGYGTHKIIFIIISLLLMHSYLYCQCPDKNVLKQNIFAVYHSTQKKTAVQLKELLQLAEQLKICHLEKDSLSMFLSQKIGVLYFKEGNYTDAINFTEQSVHIAKACLAIKMGGTMALVDNYSNLLYYYDITGQEEKKYAAIDSCIAYVLQGGSGFDMLLPALADKTEYLFNKGEYSLCSNYAKLGEDIVQKYYHQKDSIDYIVIFVAKQANALFFSKNGLTAKNILEKKITEFVKKGDTKFLYAFYYLLGLIYQDLKQHDKALAFFKQAYQADLVLKYNKGCAQSLVSTGMLLAKNYNKCDVGLTYCATALKYADATDSLFIFKQTGNIYALQKNYNTAQDYFQRAFNTVRHGMDETTMLQNSFAFPGFNLLQNLSDLTTDKGDAFVQQYFYTKNDVYLKKALAIYKKGDLFLAKIKTEQQLLFGSNLVWRSTARNLYEHAIEACYANNNMEDAFYFFEKSRSILLNDQINEQRWMADTDIANQAAIKKNITHLERKITSLPPASAEYLAAQKELYNATSELRVLQSKLKRKNPAYYQNYLDTTFINLQQLRQNILKGSKALMEIFAGDTAVYVLTIAPASTTFIKVNQHLYDSVTGSFNTALTNPGLLNKNFNGFVKTAHRLYNLLFPKNILPITSLIISPDGKGFPFEAMVTNDNPQHPEYLLSKYATSYTYSAKYLTNNYTGNSTATNKILGIAPVQYKVEDSLATLSGSDISLKNINVFFSNATNYVMEKATRNNFLQSFPSYNILQLYTHAADSSANNDPVIYFADSALYLSDLVTDRKPVTQLVVLSACETANGKLYQGEGIFSFNRGFAALGIPAAVSNLWPVDNISTYAITELFYKYLSQGLPTDVALQKAKLAFISANEFTEKKMPYYWAGTILTGKVDTFASSTGKLWKAITASIVTLLLITFIIRKNFFKPVHKQPLPEPKPAP